MTRYSLSILEEDFDTLCRRIIRSDRVERAAYLLCAKAQVENDVWSGSPQCNFLVRDVIPVAEHDIISSSTSHVTWDTNSYISVLKRARNENCVVSIVHNHGDDYLRFSSLDDDNESDLALLGTNRNGPNNLMLSTIITPSRKTVGRVWEDSAHHKPISAVRIVGKSFKYSFVGTERETLSAAFDRQVLAFGKAFSEEMRNLRVAIVGCGGTGSATATLLARLGVGHIVLIDKDHLDITNVNRLHGSTIEDAKRRRLKIDVVKGAIDAIGLDCEVRGIAAWVTDPVCYDALKSCEVIFGCSDDNQGRLFLNRFAYYYLTPVIDMGLAIELAREGPARIQALDGRVTVLAPGNPCLLCLDVVNIQRAVSETLKRTDPEEFERQKREAYVLGENEPSPAVVTFTTELATMAVNEFIHRLQGFRGEEGQSDNRVRLFHRMHDLRPTAPANRDCMICDERTVWGRGDVEPFMDRVE